MPASEDVKTDPRQRLSALEAAVDALIARLTEAENRAGQAEGRREEVESLLREMTEGDADPAEMAERLESLEVENEDLRSRVDRGLDSVDRLLSQVRFLESQR